jgi:hypothetical protein
MAWPRIMKPRSSAQPAAREHEGTSVTAAPDAGPAPGIAHNTGISGTRHSVAVPGRFQAGGHARAAGADQAGAGRTGMNANHQEAKGTGGTEAAGMSEAAAFGENGTGVLEGTVITGTPADALAVSPGPPAPPGTDAHARHHDTGRARGPYDETAGVVYEVTPPGGFAALGLAPDPAAPASGDAAGTPETGPQEAGEPEAEAPEAEPSEAESPAGGAGARATPTIVISGLGQSRTLPQGDSAPGPAWNQDTAFVHGAGEAERTGLLRTFGALFSRGGEMRAGERDRPPLTRVRDLPLDQKLRIWRNRALIVIAVGIVFTVIADWGVGLTLAIAAGIADTIYRARTVESHYWTQPGTVDRATWRAQKRTQRQLARMERAGYTALHRRPIPDSTEVIDHLVIGPTGVYAIDSEKWDKDLPVRAKNGKTLFHGPQNMKERLEHARWEASQASELLSRELGTEIAVRPALAIYGPPIPWDIAVIRDVDVFSGNRLRKYLHSRARKRKLPRLPDAEITRIKMAAASVLPLEAGKAAAPVG